MSKIYFQKSASKLHVDLYSKSLKAMIKYKKNRGLDFSELESELSQLNKFYNL